MIENALSYLAIMLSTEFTRVLGEKCQFRVVHSSLMESGRTVGNTKPDCTIGYIRPVSVASDAANRKPRNLTYTAQGDSVTYAVSLHPCRVDVECKVSLYRGHGQLYRLIPAIVACQLHGLADFTLNISLGGERKVPVAVQVRSDDVSIEFPEIETDVDSGEAAVTFNLSLFNVFSIIGDAEVPKILELDSKTKVQTYV